MNDAESSSKRVRVLIRPRYILAFIAGAVANVFGMCASGSVGMFAIVTLPLVSGIVSAFSVLFCALFGQCLDIFDWERVWWSGFAVAGGLVVFGLGLYTYGIMNRQPVLGSDPEEPMYKLGKTYWPGFFLFVFGVMHFPTARE